MIDRDTLLAERKSLEAQKADKLRDLERIEGAQQMVEHLLTKLELGYAQKARDLQRLRLSTPVAEPARELVTSNGDTERG